MRFFLPNIKKFRQIIFDFRVSIFLFFQRKKIIYIRLSHFHLFSLIALSLMKKKYFLELNGIMEDDLCSSNGYSKFISKFIIWQERMMISRAQGVIGVSGKITSHAKKFNSNAITIKNRVAKRFFDIARSEGVNERLSAIYVGTYTSWDGSDVIPALAKAFPQIEFVMIGDGDRRVNIQNSSPPNMKFLGYVPYMELADYYARADFGIVLYEFKRHENVELSSLKTLEYIASGLPIYTTNVPGQEFIMKNGVGFCCDEGDELAAFSNFIENLSSYKSRLVKYRLENKNQLLWAGAAAETKSFILDKNSQLKIASTPKYW